MPPLAIVESTVDQPDFTARQVQLLEMLAEGKSNKEIAYDLKIAYGTVKQHLFTLFRKINVSNRSKAAIVAQELVKSGLRRASNQLQNRPKAAGYQWRLISAVAFAIKDHPSLATAELAQKDIFLVALHHELERLATALDGQHMVLPDGGALIWFGHPRAHEDDAERALYLVQCMLHWHQQRPRLPNDIDEFSVGIASHTEVVAENAQRLFAVHAFKLAVSLAGLAKKLSYPLVSQLTQRLCADANVWLTLRPIAKFAEGQEKKRQDVFALTFDPSPNTTLADRWGGLPFVASLCKGVAAGTAEWLEVSSWTPASIASLLEAIGTIAQSNGFSVFRARLPSSKSRETLLASLAVQIDTAFGDSENNPRNSRMSAGERLAERLGVLAKDKPLCILLYGHQSLNTFRSLLTAKGVDRLAATHTLVAAVVPADGKSKATIRTLGAKGTGLPLSRAFTLELPGFVQLEEGLRAAVQSLLDDVSPLAKEIMLKAARQNVILFKSILPAFDNPHHELQAALQELTALGILIPTRSGDVQLRDPLLAEAIRQLEIPADVLPA
ncbi:MAG: helix-turn-helix domain-containing protein [Fluviibacter sp.]